MTRPAGLPVPAAEAVAVPMAAKLAFLRRLEPGSALRETHMSWVVLGRRRVLKMKKPVRYAYLDFSTLAARERFCREEVRLNRRLAADVYRGVRALVRGDDGRLLLAGADGAAGAVVEWLVEMRRLPEAAMLDAALAVGRATPAQVAAVARRLADFYATAERVSLTPAAYLDRLHGEVALARAILSARDFMLDHGRDVRVLDGVERRLDALAATLCERVSAGLIVDGHGDLRPEHVCLSAPPAIIDCLEFNAALRAVDPYEEIAALDMECRRLGAAWVGPILFRALADRIGQRPPAALIECHVALRALTRARLALAHLLEPSPRTPTKWQPMAQSYLAVAEAALRGRTAR